MSKFQTAMQSKTTRFIKYITLSLLTIFSSANIAFGQTGLKAQYFDGVNFDKLVTERYEPNINQHWNDTPPVPGIDPHYCSIRWTGKIKTDKTGTYSFSAYVDDGIRVWIDGEMIIDQWNLNDVGQFKGTRDMEANKTYDLKVEYFNAMIEGEIQLLWKMHKEDLSWYERLFGDDIPFSLIEPENFLPPNPPKIAKKEESKPKKKVQKKPVVKQKKKPQPKPSVPKPPPSPPTSTPELKVKTEPVRPVVSAAIAERYIPKNVQFEKGKTVILASSFKELNSFVAFLKKYPHLNVMVEGHTDVIGDPNLNMQLSKDRAKTIFDYLVKQGIEPDRIQHEGYGSTRPLFVPLPGKYHPENRRVVFLVEGIEE